MRLSLDRDALLKALHLISGVIDRKQTKAILANVLLQYTNEQLELTASDTTIELSSKVAVLSGSSTTAITLPGRKLYDICRSLPENITMHLSTSQERVVINAGNSRFILATLPAHDFPVFTPEDMVATTQPTLSFTITEAGLYHLLRNTSFAIGQQDVRKYLNGLVCFVDHDKIEFIAADGHRFALSHSISSNLSQLKLQLLLPRKSALELLRLLTPNDTTALDIIIAENYIRVTNSSFTFTAKLIYTAIPDYHKLLPQQPSVAVVTSRSLAQQALSRVAILSHEKFRNIKWALSAGQLLLSADNPEREEAEEIIPVTYDGPAVKGYFNVAYLLDVLNTISTEQITWEFVNIDDGLIIRPANALCVGELSINSVYIVMPLLVTTYDNSSDTTALTADNDAVIN
jgi:DNA polymerase-3 subunit beta